MNMIISRTPYRVSFFGGGSDYPNYYLKHGGAVLATTIDKYCYITCRYLPPFFDHKLRIVWSKIELCNSISEITHPAVRATLEFLDLQRGLEIHYDGDLPARSGMGSSSSFVVSLLHSLYALSGHMASKEQLALESIHIEQDILNENVGSQDQYSASYGGFNRLDFSREGDIAVSPIIVSGSTLDNLEDHLMLFYTGIIRTASDIAKGYIQNAEAKKAVFAKLHSMVDESIRLLQKGDIMEFGNLLHSAWEEKRKIAPVISNNVIDNIYLNAKSAGAIGGKITGAGGGGFMLLFVPPEKQHAVRERLGNLVHVPFKFERQGSQIIHYQAGEDYAEIERDNFSREIGEFSSFEAQSAAKP